MNRELKSENQLTDISLQKMSVAQHSLSEPVFQNDVKLHESPARSPCDRCGQVFDTFDDLQNHPFECISMGKLNSPLKKVKTECVGSRPAKKKYNEIDLACNAYKEIFEDSKDLQSLLTDCSSMNDDAVDVHPVKRARIEKAKSYHCGECSKAFKTKVGLKNHIKLHSGERPFVCSTCGRGFVQEICLKAHIDRIHGDKMYTCSIPGCNKVFRSENYAKVHLKIHNKIFDFACDLCDKRFVDRQSLKIHVRSHTREKPFECNVCQKRFSQRPHLKTHQRLHTKEKPFVCNVCGKAFRQTSNLNEHKAIYHKV